MNTILALKAKSNQGKSHTMRILHHILFKDNNFKLIDTNLTEGRIDFYSYFQFKSIIVGITSCGDAYQYVNEGLEFLISVKCSICICTCRSFGMTHDAIKEFTNFNNEFYDKQSTQNPSLELQLNTEDATILYNRILALLVNS